LKKLPDGERFGLIVGVVLLELAGDEELDLRSNGIEKRQSEEKIVEFYQV
jgi:hypothetical protein